MEIEKKGDGFTVEALMGERSARGTVDDGGASGRPEAISAHAR